MRKKQIIRFGSFLTLTAPVVGVVSCGDSEDTLYVGIRAEDLDLWKSVEEQFEAATGLNVEFQFVSDMTNDYALWSDTGLLPDVTIVDSSAAKLGHDEGWFIDLDLKDIVENNDYLLDQELLDDDYKQNSNLEFNDKYFSMGTIDSVQIVDAEDTSIDYYSCYPVIWGPQILYVWTEYEGTDLFDGTKELKWYVPSADGNGGVEEVTFNDDDNPLISADGDPYMNTFEDVQEFIMQAGNADQAIYNGKIATNTSFDVSTSSNPEDFVFSTGTAGMNQRLNSVAIMIQEISQIEDGDGFTAGISFEPSLGYSQIYQGQAPFEESASTNSSDVGNMLDDDKWSSSGNDSYKFQLESDGNNITTNNLSALTEQLYFSYIGYLDNDHIKTSLQLEADDMTQSFAEYKVAMLSGAKWQQESIMDKAGNSSEAISCLALPFQETGVDGYAISASTDKEEEAKQFVRFLMQENIAAEIAGDKAVSVVTSAVELQPQDAFKPIADAIENAGKAGVINTFGDNVKTFDFPYEVVKSSTNNVYDTWNNMLIQTDLKAEVFHLDSSATSLSDFVTVLNEIAADYKTQIELTN